MTPDLEEKVSTAKSLDEIIAILAEEGHTVRKEELERILNANDELTEDELEDVAGGRVYGFNPVIPWWKILKKIFRK